MSGSLTRLVIEMGIYVHLDLCVCVCPCAKGVFILTPMDISHSLNALDVNISRHVVFLGDSKELFSFAFSFNRVVKHLSFPLFTSICMYMCLGMFYSYPHEHTMVIKTLWNVNALASFKTFSLCHFLNSLDDYLDE